MSDDSPKVPAPRPKPPPRPGAAAAASPNKPPVPVAAKPPPPPPPVEENPFLPPESQRPSSRNIDAGWLSLDDAEVVPESTDARPPDSWAAAVTAKSTAALEPTPPPVAKVAPAAAPAPVAIEEPPAAPEKTEKTPSDPPPIKKRSGAKVLAFVMLPLLAIAGGGYVYQSQMAAKAKMQVAAPTPTQTTPEPVLSYEPPPPPTHTPDPPPSASAAPAKVATGGAAPVVNIDPAKRAYLDGSALSPGRKIVVDGRVMGTSPRKVAVQCGVHRVQIGDQAPETIDFPCGGEVDFTE